MTGHFARHAPKHSDQRPDGFSGWLGSKITTVVGTMTCALAFAILAFVSLPDAIHAGRPAIISWVAQTFLQLVLLSIILVGQKVQSRATDAQTAHLAEGVDALVAGQVEIKAAQAELLLHVTRT